MSTSPDNGPVLKEGFTLGHYVIREYVGEGPLGRVYKAVDTQFDVVTALKIIHPAFSRDKAVRAETVNVFRSLIEFESDGFVKIFDADVAGEHLFVATDYLEGLTLRRLMDLRSGGKFAWEEAEPVVDAVCHAIESMRPGEVHGDLKPENIVILPESVKLTDLGLARIVEPAQFVSAQVVAGNPYMAPELAQDAERIGHDPAVDVYAIGVLMYQLLTGALPQPGDLRPGKRVPTLPGKIDEIVARALAADPDERYAHAAELHLDLAHLAGKAETAAKVEIFLHELPERAKAKKPEAAPPPPPPSQPSGKTKSLFDESLLGESEAEVKAKAPAAAPPPPPPPAAKSKMPLIAGAVGAVVAAAAVIGFLATRPQEPPPAPEAPAAAAKPAKPAEDPKPKAQEALARAEKSRDDAMKVDAAKLAPDLFVAAMKDLRDADDLVKAKKYGAAQEKAAAAEKQFQESIIKSVSAQIDAKSAAPAGKSAEKKPAAAAAEEPKPAAPAEKKPPCAADMVLIPAGAFVMGSASNDADRNPGEKYNESVSVPGYCIDKYEYPNKKGTPPQVNVTWNQAKDACAAKGRRLCTETEWEKACKGPGNLKFPYGAKFEADKCNTEDAKGDDRALGPAGKFAACVSGYGVADLSGNAWEWTESQLQSTLKDRVLRGGSFTRPDYHDRCANRYNSLPSVADKEFGFRCCADVNP